VKVRCQLVHGQQLRVGASIFRHRPSQEQVRGF
jgi:hypothetical protein